MSATSTPSEIANAQSALPSITVDGRYVAFESHASNLTASDNPNSDVFVRNMNNRVATLISVDPIGNVGGGSFSPDISADGRYVTFHSFASFAGQDNNAGLDIYLRDLEESSTTLVSKSSSGELANGPSDYPVITPDGRYVAFRSAATNLVPGDTNGQPDIFLRDLLTNTTERVSLAATGAQSTGYTMNRISVSSDARYVAFESVASNLVPKDSNSDWDVFVRDRQAGTTTAVSVTPLGVTGNLGSYFPSMSPDGRYVAFHAWSSNLVLSDSNNLPDVFVHDRQTNTTALVSQTWTSQGNGISDYPAISSDGRYVAFRSFSSNLAKGDLNSRADIFKKDLTTGVISPVSTVPGKGNTANSASARPDMSSDGSIIAFETDATNIVPNDTNGARDIVLRSTGFKGVTTMENAAPTASVDVSPPSGDLSTAFEATVDITDPDGDPASYYEVRWGDGESSSYTDATHAYAAAGTYNVTAVVCDQFSLCSDPSSPVSVHVDFSNRDPVASLNVTPSQGDLRTTFSANMDGTYDPDGDTLSYSIDWGDGSVTDGSNGSHQYAMPGTYEIVGTARDPFGGSGGDLKTVRVCGVASGSTCVSPPQVTDPWRCSTPETCEVSDTVETGLNEASRIDSGTCDAIRAICSQVVSAVSEVSDKRPASPVQLPNATLTVVTANVLQAFADDAPPNCRDTNDKMCNQLGRRAIFAQRLKALATKSGTADSMSLSPDIILLQEVRGEDLCGQGNDTCTGEVNDGIVGHLRTEFKADYRVATFLSNDNVTIPEESNANHDTEADTAVIYLATTMVDRDDNHQHIETTYTSEQGCDEAFGVVLTPSLQDACAKQFHKWHAVALLQPRDTNYLYAVASVHLVPDKFLKPAHRNSLRRQWAEDLAVGIREKYHPDPMDPDPPSYRYVLAGDFNGQHCQDESGRPIEHRDCRKSPQDKVQPWWKYLRSDADPILVDSVLARNNNGQTDLDHQYKDGCCKRPDGTYTHERGKRIDLIWVEGGSVRAASHDLSCGQSLMADKDLRNCDYPENPERYSDHRLVWARLRT